MFSETMTKVPREEVQVACCSKRSKSEFCLHPKRGPLRDDQFVFRHSIFRHIEHAVVFVKTSEYVAEMMQSASYEALKHCTVNPTTDWPVSIPNVCSPCNEQMEVVNQNVEEELYMSKILFGVELSSMIQCSLPCMDQAFWSQQYMDGTNRWTNPR